MKITVISDTHKNYHRLKDVAERNLDSDLILHLGDGLLEVLDLSKEYSKKYPNIEFAYVRGNCDFAYSDNSDSFKDDRIIKAGDINIFCTHGHNYNVHWELDTLIKRAKSMYCKIALFGHTHIYRTELKDDVYIMNPGSLERPRGNNRPTYGTITISDSGAVEMNIVAYKNPSS